MKAVIEGPALAQQSEGFILFITWYASRVVAEAMIAGTMVAFLYLHRTGFPRTDRVLNILARYATTTGLVPSVMSLAILLLCTFYRNRLQFAELTLSLPLGTLDVFTLLANLHVRNQLRMYLRAPGPGFAQSIHLSRLSAKVKRRLFVGPLESSSTKEVSVTL